MITIAYHKNYIETADNQSLFDIVTTEKAGWQTTSLLKDGQLRLDVSIASGFSGELSFHVNKGGLVLLYQDDQKLTFFLPGAEYEHDTFKVNFIAETETTNNKVNEFITPKTHTPQTVTTQAMILAAGYATRLEPISGEISGYCKPALPIKEQQAVIEFICRHLASFGIQKFIVNTCFLRESVKQALSKLPQEQEIEIIYIDEEEASGTGGGLFKAIEAGVVDTTQPILIAQGDCIMNFDLGLLLNKHIENNAMVTLGTQVVPDSEVHRFGIVDSDDTGKIYGFKEKPALKDAGPSRLANAGLYVLSEKAYAGFIQLGKQIIEDESRLYDFSQDYFKYILEVEKSKFYTVVLDGYWSDIGNPDAYFKTIQALAPNNNQSNNYLSIAKSTTLVTASV